MLAYLATVLKESSVFPYEPPAGNKRFRDLIAGFMKTYHHIPLNADVRKLLTLLMKNKTLTLLLYLVILSLSSSFLCKGVCYLYTSCLHKTGIYSVGVSPKALLWRGSKKKRVKLCPFTTINKMFFYL